MFSDDGGQRRKKRYGRGVTGGWRFLKSTIFFSSFLVEIKLKEITEYLKEKGKLQKKPEVSDKFTFDPLSLESLSLSKL